MRRRHRDTSVREAMGDLRLEGLRRVYGDVVAVDHLDLTVPQGSFFALVGPSGCGKTTTLRMVAGLDRPDAGRILVGDADLTRTRAHERPVNTVFQSYALFPHLSVLGNVAFGPQRRGLDRRTAVAAARSALDLVQLGSVAERRPQALSGGQQQRVALARAIVNQPQVLLLDEPLGALDLTLRRQMQVELKRVQAEIGLTFVHVTHDQEEAMSMADTVAVMNHGRIEQLGPPAELYDLPRTAFVANFLGQSNLVPGTLVGTEGDLAVVELAGQRVRVLAGRCVDQPDGRRQVLVGVRPEKVRLLRPDDPVDRPAVTNVLARGRVRNVAFSGVATQYLVDLPGAGTWTVFEQNLGVDATAAVGDEVGVAWDLRHTFTLAGDEDPTAGRTELDATGLDATGLDATGLDATGLDQTGLGATGVHGTGLDQTGARPRVPQP
ncbi:ABC transporter ATP-binding protein [Arsenicicoccus piscis]|uniref:Polyamine-transporting ATPase n=1 Tax=Arsenicicoccus piscis TaxID=673954 RepID=A0ABQ6HQ27_9MICO|nr:ABC transporter ATP-binding protein [Arsenicicoccus piscis]MCH8628778.1 ABC transporter ATP-binding protein [Arsenicicoccus piscis]GMA20178.1 polyamine-transporting ATPase [Arsenicicoccus piscis]